MATTDGQPADSLARFRERFARLRLCFSSVSISPRPTGAPCARLRKTSCGAVASDVLTPVGSTSSIWIAGALECTSSSSRVTRFMRSHALLRLACTFLRKSPVGSAGNAPATASASCSKSARGLSMASILANAPNRTNAGRVAQAWCAALATVVQGARAICGRRASGRVHAP